MKNLKNDLKQGTFQKVYLLYGDEGYLKTYYKKKLKEAILPEDDTMNYSAWQGKNINEREVIDQAETMPFFAEHRLLVIEQSGFFKSSSDLLPAYIAQIPEESILVFIEDAVDKRNKLYKEVKKHGRVVELGRQDEKTLQSWMLGLLKKEKVNITRDAMELFLEMTAGDMEKMVSELEKLISYIGDRTAIEKQDIQEICSATTEGKIFEMIQLLTEKKQKKALELYYDLLSLKEPPMRILFLIARQFNQMFLLKSMEEEQTGLDAAAKSVGLTTFIARKVLSRAAVFTVEELKEAVTDCIQFETDVKTGKLNDRLAVEMLIIKYSSAKQ